MLIDGSLGKYQLMYVSYFFPCWNQHCTSFLSLTRSQITWHKNKRCFILPRYFLKQRFTIMDYAVTFFPPGCTRSYVARICNVKFTDDAFNRIPIHWFQNVTFKLVTSATTNAMQPRRGISTCRCRASKPTCTGLRLNRPKRDRVLGWLNVVNPKKQIKK